MKTFMLSKPHGNERIPPAILAFVGRKMRNDLHHLVLDAFRKSGITQAELAERLGADKAQVSRQLGAPGNWTTDTAAKLLFAINGHTISLVASDPGMTELGHGRTQRSLHPACSPGPNAGAPPPKL